MPRTPIGYVRVPKRSWAWQVLDDALSEPNHRVVPPISHTYLDDLVRIDYTDPPPLPPGVIGYFAVDKRIFISVTKALSLDSVFAASGAGLIDAATTGRPTVALAYTLIRAACSVKFLSEREREFLEVMLGKFAPGDDIYSVPVKISTIAASYAVPEESRDGHAEVAVLLETLYEKGVVTVDTVLAARATEVTLVK